MGIRFSAWTCDRHPRIRGVVCGASSAAQHHEASRRQDEVEGTVAAEERGAGIADVPAAMGIAAVEHLGPAGIADAVAVSPVSGSERGIAEIADDGEFARIVPGWKAMTRLLFSVTTVSIRCERIAAFPLLSRIRSWW
jgi:hypothetical protein